MNYRIGNHTLTIACIFIIFSSCKDDQKNLSSPAIPDQSFTEEFETKAASRDIGWIFINSSDALGTSDWTNPLIPPFPPYSSHSFNGYLRADYNSTSSAAGIISNWAISPIKIFQNGDAISFYTRSEIVFYNNDSIDFVNRLQLRLNTRNDGTNIGNGLNTGDFNIVLLDINPDYKNFSFNEYIAGSNDALLAYPHKWTRFQITINGLTEPTKGRFAFRYFVEAAGNNGRATSIAIDKVEFTSAHK